MTTNKTIVVQIRELQHLSVNQLRDKYMELFGEETRTRNRISLIKRIAYRIQEQAEGTLSERARRRAHELADEAHIRVRPHRVDPEVQEQQAAAQPERDDRLPPPGTVLVRDFRGQRYEVTVLEDGFSWRGERYGSLSAVAHAITGTPWNGFRFFQKGLRVGRRAAHLAAPVNVADSAGASHDAQRDPAQGSVLSATGMEAP